MTGFAQAEKSTAEFDPANYEKVGMSAVKAGMDRAFDHTDVQRELVLRLRDRLGIVLKPEEPTEVCGVEPQPDGSELAAGVWTLDSRIMSTNDLIRDIMSRLDI